MKKEIEVKGVKLRLFELYGSEFISLSDMIKAKDGDYFISDWLRNRNILNFLAFGKM